MANYWAIEIGISQYRFLPPLSYAQRDAELLHQVLLQSGFVAQHCNLLADQITQTNADPGFPSGANIRAALTRLQQIIQPDDLLICFFSGHGLQHQGKDYLLPIEADPRKLAETGLAVEDLLNQLKASPSQNILLLLDANRSQLGFNQVGFNPAGATHAGQGFGTETMRLAETLGIAVLLSCQPDQVSHEPLTLRQGIFTAALTTALSDCITLEQLVSRLSQQLPQLSEEFWRPRQDLQAVVPSHLRYRLLIPDIGAVRPALNVLAGGTQSEQAIDRLTTDRVLASGRAGVLPRPGNGLLQTISALLTQAFPARADASAQPSPITSSSMADAATLAFPDSLETTGLSDQFFWRRLLAQGGLIAGILLFGVILRNSSSLINSTESSDPASTFSTADLSTTQSQPNAATTASSSPAQPTASASASPSSTNQSIASVSAPTAVPATTIDPALLMQAAQSAVDAGQYDEANRQLVQIPASQRSIDQQQLLEQVNRELLNQAKTMLIRTRSPMPENQVSDLVEAIKVARLIKTDQPLYAEAQQNIDRWSRLILDMAQGRAERANGSSAVDAADNYSKAIAAARLVPDDQTAHEQAQQSVSLWSKKILDLANTRASNGELDLAIQIGELVPPNTADYAAAQEAIANWRNQPSPVN